MSASVRTVPCRTCGEAIAFAAGGKGWVPCEPASLENHVEGADGRPIFDRLLGHRRHECSGRATLSAGADALADLHAARDALEEASRALASALARLDAARRS